MTAYDSPIYIADAALYLSKTQPDLGIEDPYALDEDQLAAAVDLLKKQRENVGEYWSDYLKETQAFKTGDSVVGTTWQVIVNLAQSEKAPVEAILPEEGATGWSDTWMVSSKTEHPNCAYAWLDHIVSPEANAAVAEWFGEAPANEKACDLTSKGFCDSYHAGDEAYAEQIHYWTTPIEQCLDGRTDVHVHDLPGLDAGLDRDQGLTRGRTASAGRRWSGPAPPPPPRCGSGSCWGRRCCGWGCSTSGSLAALFITSLWTVDAFGGNIERIWNLDNYRDLFTLDVYRTITVRTLLTAAAVTVIDAVLAFPIALYMAKVASPRRQRLLVIAVLTPLWASYLVKAYAWRGCSPTAVRSTRSASRPATAWPPPS